MCERSGHDGDCDCYDCVEARLGRRGGPGRGCGGPPDAIIDDAENWKDAFRRAYREVQVDLLKLKIKAAMGKSIEKVAQITVEAMLAERRDNQKRAQAQKAATEKFEKQVKEAQ